MTIITKAKSEKKQSEKPLVVSEVQGSECGDIRDPERNDMNNIELEMWLSPSVRRRISTTTTVCFFITALLVMSICIIGGVYLYRQVTQHQRMSRFRGWCGIPFEKNALHFGHKDHLIGPNRPYLKEEDNAEWLSAPDRFKEEFDLDLDSGLYERIDVPDFGYGRKGQFIHDFKANKTGIIDLTTKRCFVMPLDRKHIKPPRSMFDLLSKMWMDYYNIDTKVVRRTMRVVQPPIQDLNTQGTYIAHNCAGFPTFLLVSVDEQETRKRRSADGRQRYEAAAADEEPGIRLAEFAGKNIVEYTILED